MVASPAVCDGYLPAVPQKTKRTGSANCAIIWPGPKPYGQPLSRRALAEAVRRLNIVGPVSRVLAGPLPQDAVTFFDFFRCRVGTSPNAATTSYSADGNSGFWDRTLLQTAHSEPAVWNAVAALGALHRRWEYISGNYRMPSDVGDSSGCSRPVTEIDSVVVELAERAGNCYAKALSLASSIHESSHMLVLSIALAVAASMAAKWTDYPVHIRAGQNLVSHIAQAQAEGKQHTTSELGINDAVDCLEKVYLQWASFSEARAPILHAVGMHCDRKTAVEDQNVESINQSLTALLRISTRILAQAGVELSQKASLEADDSTGVDPLNPTNKHEVEDPILKDFFSWRQQTLRILTTTASNSTYPASPTLLTLKLYHTFVHLLLLVGVGRSDYNELSWDNYTGHFERIITLSVLYLQAQSQRNPLAPSVVSFDEPGVIMLLWLTVSRCRHPLIRRRAVALLYSLKRQEGPWLSPGASVISEKFIIVEEKGSPDISMPTLVPDFCSTALCTDFEVGLARLIEAEDHDPQSWLMGGSGFGLAWTSWEVPGTVLVPLHRRITEVSINVGSYGPTSIMHNAEVTMFFAEKDAAGEARQYCIPVDF